MQRYCWLMAFVASELSQCGVGADTAVVKYLQC